MILNDKKGIHFVGIGGIGMSGIAHVLLEMGYKVSGSDLELNNLTDKAAGIGGKIFKGHTASNLPEEAGTLVYSSSIAKDNPELIAAASRGIRIVHRAEMLGELFNQKRGIAVTGTHGKTTTTSLISVMLENLNSDPTVIIGGEVGEFNGNAKFGRGPDFVAEADESDSSFLHLEPYYAVMTNIEMEHIDHYATLDHAKKAYRSFLYNLKPGGMIFYNYGDLNARDIVKGLDALTETFGFSKEADIHPVDIKMSGFRTSFKCVYKDKVLGVVELNIPGRHNVLNALAAILVGLNMGFEFYEIKNSIREFIGAKRRFQLRTEVGGVMHNRR